VTTTPAPDRPSDGVTATRALVLHPDIPADRKGRAPEPALAEAVALARALPGLTVVGEEIVRLKKPRPGLLFGDGKIAELAEKVSADEVGLVLIDGPVTPVQQRNLEKKLGTKLLDRTGLILEIFADRAQTREGVLQVDLAALSYQRTRLVRAWTHLERQRGGLGFVGGPGETQIEADRRAIDEAVGRIKRQLAKVVKTRSLHRQARKKVPYPIVALVGYTNAGKSTLFNRLTGAEVMAKDMLFATLDPTMRAVKLPDGSDVILSDTVGFISDLPTHLVAAFRATLEEVRDADLILHVRDISHPETEEQAADVRTILADLGIDAATPLIEVWNKTDLLPPAEAEAMARIAERRDDVFALSAWTGEGMGPLLAATSRTLSPPRSHATLTLPHSDGRRRAWLFDQGIVETEERGEDTTTLTVHWTARQEKAFAAL
jgi:GTP-binding protein HflX